VRPLFDSKRLYLETEVPVDLPPISCDRTRIREVLLNLLSNAGRFTERGGVRVRVQEQSDGVVVSVTDTGTGIATELSSTTYTTGCGPPSTIASLGTSSAWTGSPIRP